MIDWKPYLESICQKYDCWWGSYTITNVVSKKHDKQMSKSLLFDLQALTVQPESIKAERGLLPEAREANEKREILNVLEGLRKYALLHVLLVGRPGSGKSTALMRLLLEEAEGFGNTGNGKIPVLVELRYYETSILNLIIAFLHRHDPSLNLGAETIKTLLRQGQFFLLIDGVNELPSQEAKRNLQKFRYDYQQTTPMVFTTRDLGVGGDLGIDKKLEMQPLTETQMEEFVCGYLPETGEQMLQQLGGRLRKFGETPLLLMMLCSVFASNENQIPPNLGLVFRRFTEIYDRQLKQDIPVSDKSKRWWKRLLQHLAWTMMSGNPTNLQCISSTEFLVAIPRQQAEEIFTKYLKGKVNCAADCAIKWLDDLLKHHLIQIGAENKIEFRHQLIQEYYGTERFLQEIRQLSDDELQWDYFNYLKWTEPTALMLGLLDDEGLALRVVRLALQVDWQLGARLAGEVKFEWQEKTVALVESLNIPPVLKIRLLGKTQSNVIISSLIQLLEDENLSVRSIAAYALGEIKSEKAIPGLIKLLEYEDSYIRFTAVNALQNIKSKAVVLWLVKLLKDENLSVCSIAAYALGEIKSEKAILGLVELLEEGIIPLLEKVKYNPMVPALIEYTFNHAIDVLYNAASALEKIKPGAALSILMKLLEDKNPCVCISCVHILGKIKSNAAIPKLVELLEHKESDVRYSAASALKKIKSDINIPKLVKVLEYDIPIEYQEYSNFAVGSDSEKLSVDFDTADKLIKLESNAEIDELIKTLKLASDNGYLDMLYLSSSLVSKIKSDIAISQLINLLNIDNFVQANDGISLLQAIEALENIQQHVKYYKPKPTYTMSNILSHNYALLIGVGECEEPKLSLPTTVKDIQAVKTLLTDEKLCGYIDNDQHLRSLSNTTATSENILDGLNWLKQQAENDPEATIFIYYSGHGCLDESGDYYLIPYETDRVDIPNTALPATKFNAALQQIAAKQLLVIIDSCHAQGMASSKEGANRPPLPKGFIQAALPKNIIDELKQGTGKVVFTSSTGNQSSWIRPDGKMSVYTYHFLEALQGAANQPGDKVVRVSHLMKYLSKTVPETARNLCKAEQTPFFDFATEDFPVALLCGGKGLATVGWDKQEAEDKIRAITNQVNSGVGNVGDRNIGINIGTAGNITFGDLSSGS